jgi:hypothetical protein
VREGESWRAQPSEKTTPRRLINQGWHRAYGLKTLHIATLIKAGSTNSAGQEAVDEIALTTHDS